MMTMHRLRRAVDPGHTSKFYLAPNPNQRVKHLGSFFSLYVLYIGIDDVSWMDFHHLSFRLSLFFVLVLFNRFGMCLCNVHQNRFNFTAPAPLLLSIFVDTSTFFWLVLLLIRFILSFVGAV